MGLERWLRWSAHPLVVLCVGHVPSFCSWSLRSGNWSVAFLYLIEHNYFGSAVKRKKKICFQCRNCRRARFDPWWGRSFEGELGNPLRDSCLENPMDRGAWWATVHGIAKSRTQSDFAHMYIIFPNWENVMHAVIFSLMVSLYPLAQGDVWLKCKSSRKGSQVSGPSLTHKDLFLDKSRHDVGCIRMNKRGQDRQYK